MAFDRIVGQTRALQSLQEAFTRQRIPNAYLFAGPRGVGKALTAHEMSKLINCLGPRVDVNPCDMCASCRKIDHGNHLDISTIEPDNKTFKIQQIRELQRILRFPPQEAKMRVLVLDGVERMNVESANAFLKILEEPPPQNLFILLSSSPSQLLPTILSRCQRVPFAPLARDVMQNLLVERHGFDQIRAELAAGLSEGSMSRALALDANLTGEDRRHFLQRLIRLHEPIQGCALALDLAEELKDKGEHLSLYFDLLRTWYRDLLFLRELQTGREQVIHRDLLPALQKHQILLSTEQLYGAIQAIEKAIDALQRNASPLLTLETLFLALQLEQI